MAVETSLCQRESKARSAVKIVSTACIAALCSLTIALAPAAAVEIIPDFYKDSGIDPNRGYVNQHHSEQIDPFTGALQIQSTDIHLPGNGGFELNVIRSYNSNAVDATAIQAYSSHLGAGWQMHFGRILTKSVLYGATFCAVNNTGSTITNMVFELPDGSRQVLYNSSIADAVLITKQRWRATCLNDSVTVYSPDGVRYDMTQLVSDSVLALYTTKITDRNGNSATIQYKSAGSAVITHVSTAEVLLYFTYETLQSYETHPRLSSISGPGGLIWRYYYTATQPTYTYQNSYQLTKVTRPDGTSWQYAYNSQNNTPGAYLMNRMTYPQGGHVNYTYAAHVFDPNKPTVVVPVVDTKQTSDGTWGFSYTPGSFNVPDRTTVTLPPAIGGTITYKHIGINYTALNNNPVWGVGLLLEKNIGGLQVETYTWDKQKISNQIDLRPGNWSTVRYDDATYAPILSKKEIVRDGGSTKYTTEYFFYDSYGNPTQVSEQGPQGGNRTTKISYYIDTYDWIIRQKKNEEFYDTILPTGTAIGTFTPYSTITRNFDGYGNLTDITQDGVTTSYPERFYTGDVKQKMDPNGNVTHYANYKFGIPQLENQLDENVLIQRTVDALGNVSSVTDGENHKRTYTYDGLNRVTSIAFPVNNPVSITYAASSKSATRGSLTQSTQYDTYARTASVTLDNVTTTYRYDALGRVTFQSNPGAAIGTTYAYDLLDRVTRITHADGSFQKFEFNVGLETTRITDERNNITLNKYRAYGDPGTQYLMSTTPPVASMATTIARNGMGLITSVVQNGVTRTYQYDANKGYYLKSMTQPEIGTTTYEHDFAGNMTSKTVGNLTTTYDYDHLNRLKTITYPSTGITPTVTHTYYRTNKLKSLSTSAATRTYEYDLNDNLKSEKLEVANGAQSFTAVYGYDGNDQLATITYPTSGRTLGYAPDKLGRPTTARVAAVNANYVTGVTYWPSGQVNKITYGNGTSSTYGQDTQRLWPNTFITAKGATNYINNSYAYYRTGDMSAVADPDNNYTRSLDYDGAGRLTKVDGPWGAAGAVVSGSIAYDGNSNITRQTFGSAQLNYVYDTNGRLTSTNGTRNTTFGYDTYGNISDADSNTFLYDDVPNLRSFNAGRLNALDYVYDGANMRVLTINKAGVKKYEFYAHNGNLLQEYTPSQDNQLVEYIYLGSKRIAQRVKNDVQAITVALTAPANNVVVAPSSNITLSASAIAISGTITKVDFYNGATLLGTATAAPYNYNWPTVAAGNYIITAVATNNQNQTQTSAPVNVFVDIPPTVSLTAPTTNSSYVGPATIALAAIASDTGGSISKVEFYSGSTLLATDTTAPYAFDWSNVAPGTYHLTAKAIDDQGVGTISAVSTVTVTSPIAVNIVTPAGNSNYGPSPTIAITANATNSNGSISKVEFFNGSTLIGTASSAPYSITWSNAPSGTAIITAKATGSQGLSNTSAPVSVTVRASPAVALLTPVNNANFVAPGNISLTSSASVIGSTITQVDYYNGSTYLGSSTQAPYSVSWNNVAVGNYAVTARATSAFNDIGTSAVVNITVNINKPPTVSMSVTPQNALAPASISLSAFVNDSDGHITKVEFFNGTNLLTSLTQAPYTFAWGNLAAGTYTLSAKATDNSAAVTTSSNVLLTVSTDVAKAYYVQTDQIYTPRQIVDVNGNVVWHWDSDAFGTTPPNQNPSGLGVFAFNQRFPGQYFDMETNLHYNYFRDYDPNTGRYVQSDPLGLRSFLNPYLYADGNPISYSNSNGVQVPGLAYLEMSYLKDEDMPTPVTCDKFTRMPIGETTKAPATRAKSKAKGSPGRRSPFLAVGR